MVRMQLPSRRAYHVIYDDSVLDALKYASENSWTGIVPDFNVPNFSPEKFSSTDREKFLEVSTRLNIEWGFHAPADDISLYSPYPPIRNGILDYFRQIIDFIREVSTNPSNLVIHAGKPPSFRKAGERTNEFIEIHRDIYTETLFSSIASLIDYAHPDVAITLENHAWNYLTRGVIKSLISKGLKLCLDIAKLYDSNQVLRDDDWKIFTDNYEAIEVVHVHDWISELGSHQIVRNGSINFEPALQLLSSLVQPAQYVFEVRPRTAAQQSLHQFEKLLKDLNMNLE